MDAASDLSRHNKRVYYSYHGATNPSLLVQFRAVLEPVMMHAWIHFEYYLYGSSFVFTTGDIPYRVVKDCAHDLR